MQLNKMKSKDQNFKAQILIIGSEFLSGLREKECNSTYLINKLEQIGLPVIGIRILPDEIEYISLAVLEAVNLSSYIFVVGGLGPTEDDLTREALAEAFDKKLVLNQFALESMEKFFLNLGREKIPENNRRQAYILDGSELIPNLKGSACGFFFKYKSDSSAGNSMIYVLPGVPFEMQAMFENFIKPKLEMKSSSKNLSKKTKAIIRTFGIPESTLEENIKKWLSEAQIQAPIRISFLPGSHGVDVIAEYSDNELGRKYKAEFIYLMQKNLGINFYAEEFLSLPEIIGELLARFNLSLAVAESCTGGLLGGKITERAGSSKYFLGSVVSYSNDVKTGLLGVSKEILSKYGAVSEAVVLEMAQGVCKILSSDLGLAVSGIAGPDSDATENSKPVGLVWLAVANKNESQSLQFRFSGDRAMIREKAVFAALFLLRSFLLKKMGHLL